MRLLTSGIKNSLTIASGFIARVGCPAATVSAISCCANAVDAVHATSTAAAIDIIVVFMLRPSQ